MLYRISVLCNYVYIRFSAFNSEAIQLLYNIIIIYKRDYYPMLVIIRLDPMSKKTQ